MRLKGVEMSKCYMCGENWILTTEEMCEQCIELSE